MVAYCQRLRGHLTKKSNEKETCERCGKKKKKRKKRKDVCVCVCMCVLRRGIMQSMKAMLKFDVLD